MYSTLKRVIAKATVSLLFLGAPMAEADVNAQLRNHTFGNRPDFESLPRTRGQFSSFAPASAVVNSGSGNAATRGVPTSGNFQLRRSIVGFSFSGNVPRYFIGDIIAFPELTFPSAGQAVPLRREPVTPEDGNFLFIMAGEPLANARTFDEVIPDGQYYFSPHAVRNVATNSSTNPPEEILDADSPRSESGFVYASRAGGLNVIWRTEFEIGQTAGNVPIYGLYRTGTSVSSGSRQKVRRIFWTENAFDGPPVDVPIGEIQQIQIAYTEGFPALVPDGEQFIPEGTPQETEGNFDIPVTRKTLWFDDSVKKLNAYNREGRVLIEFLGETLDDDGRRRQVGVEVVDVIKDPITQGVDLPLGERVYPLAPQVSPVGAYAFPGGKMLDANLITANLEALIPSEVLNTQALNEQFTAFFNVEGEPAYYAQKVTTRVSDVQFYWLEETEAGIQWPRFLNRYRQFWPENLDLYSVNIRSSDPSVSENTLPLFGEDFSGELVHQDDPTGGQATLDEGDNLEVDFDLNGTDLDNRSLVLLRNGEGFWFIRVESALDSFMATNARYADFYRDKEFGSTTEDLVALVGQRLQKPLAADGVNELPGLDSNAAWVDLEYGDAIDMTAYVDPFANGISAAEIGAVIPVNATPKKGDKINNRLGVWWFKKVLPPGTAGPEAKPLYFPSYYRRYQLRWPVDAEQIVMASNGATGHLDPLPAQGIIYTQNNPALPGYNPNEEHALLRSGQVFALRDDLNFSQSTSAPYSMVRYTDENGRPDMKVFRVLRENENYTFHYPATAGKPLLPVAPLNVLPVPFIPQGTIMVSKNHETTPPGIDDSEGSGGYYDRFTYEDRKGLKWLYRGPHDPASLPALRPSLTMKFYYKTLEGFAFPAQDTGIDTAPALGTVVPYLRAATESGWIGSDRGDDALEIRFTPYWADEGFDVGDSELLQGLVDKATAAGESEAYLESLRNAAWSEIPELQTAETIVKSKFGLPSLSGASSVEVLYQQSLAPADRRNSVLLHDPTVRKVYYLNDIDNPPLVLAEPGDLMLDKIPDSLTTSIRNGRTYFQNLPPHLEQNFYFDGNLGRGPAPLGALVLQGEFVDETVGEDYLLLNALPQSDIDLLKNLVPDSDERSTKWKKAIDLLQVRLTTFVPDDLNPGQFIEKEKYQRLPGLTADPVYVTDAPDEKIFGPKDLVQVINDDSAVNGYALTAVGGGTGYVTVMLGGGRAFTDQSEPVQMVILKVGSDLYRGQVKPFTAANPLAEQVTMQHTGDFAAQTDDYEFSWEYAPPINGQPPSQNNAQWLTYSDASGTSDLGPRITFGGEQPVLSLGDNYFRMRYRPTDGGDWSEWTDAALAEGWIKRVLAGINPFNQRVSDFYSNAINTDTSLLTQAGNRWEGAIPLTLASAQEAGLIEIYETVLKRGIDFTINGNPSVNYGPANDALLLAAGYLNDLYVALGNEAFADASNPLISLDVDPSRLLLQQGLPSEIGTTIQNTATARFAFEGQVPTLIDEELTLLRGRDDFLVPRVRTSPVYNRFFWNFTRGIDAGEVIYATNYNIRDKSGADADGVINAADAARQYPQGHGDAYGHYLTAIKNYYRLLSDRDFTWIPRVEAVNILGAPVTVDYQDERKLASAAVGLARSGSRILDLERRRLPGLAGPAWEKLRDGRQNGETNVVRSWGAEEWASRIGQGNYLNWAMVNALLPEVDTQNEGLQKIDRTTVPELNEIVTLANQIQSHLDAANNRTNALGLTKDSMMFDLSPSELAEGESHFDQVLARAKRALENASVAHSRTISTNNLLRSIENQADDYSYTVAQEEVALENRLLDIYGMAYNGEIGPGKTYPQGYAGPDFLKSMFISRPYIYSRSDLFYSSAENVSGFNSVTNPTRRQFNLPLFDGAYVNLIAGFDHSTGMAKEIADGFKDLKTVSYTMNLNSGPYQIAPTALGKRNFTGSIQEALAEVMAAEEALYVKLRSLRLSQAAFQRKANGFAEVAANTNSIIQKERAFASAKLAIDKTIGGIDLLVDTILVTKDSFGDIIDATKNAIPDTIGLANDALAPAQAALLATKVASNTALSTLEKSYEVAKFLKEVGFDIAELANNEAIRDLGRDSDLVSTIADLRGAYGSIFGDFREVDAANVAYIRALEQYQNRLIDGDTVLAERQVFRTRAAAVIQGSRVRDVAFRAFRTEALEQYDILFDQAARYVYLAAKAYDYETGQLGTEQGADFFAKIVSSRALGLVDDNGEPQFAGSGTGDPGLSSLLAQLESDWDVAKGRLGINNPDEYGTLFSLRRELMELPYKEDGSDESHTAWQDALKGNLVADLAADPDIAAHALPLSNPDGTAQPGFVIEFRSTIENGVNFFGNELVAGDSIFSSASFATKLNSVGVVFDGYEGMDPFASGNGGGQPTHNSPDALSATPYVYLIPAGIERMRTPQLGSGEGEIREWTVHDHAMPLPFDIGGSGASATSIWNSASTLSEPFYTPRKHQPFRAVNDPTLFYGRVPAEFTSSRLIGRSVWNGKWKLVIPASTLLADPEEGIERFARSVKDIKLFMRTYSHSGN